MARRPGRQGMPAGEAGREGGPPGKRGTRPRRPGRSLRRAAALPGREGGASRREALSREALLQAGLGIARREDLGRLTLRKLADHFGVTPMAVYRHFRNKAEIIDGVLDLFVREAAVTAHGEAVSPADWRRWVRLTFMAMRHALLDAPGVVPFLGTSYRFGAGATAVTDEVLDVLRGAGLSGRSAVEAYLTLIGYTLGAVGLEVAWRRSPLADEEDDREADPVERLRRSRLRFESANRSVYPRIVELAPQLADAMSVYPFEQGLERILESLENEIEHARPRGGGGR